jgi:hypothetical protein
MHHVSDLKGCYCTDGEPCAQCTTDRLDLLDPPPANGHWLAEVEGREPAYQTADTLHELCWALHVEASNLADTVTDEAEGYADMRLWEQAWNTKKRAERLEILAANLDFDRRVSAPLFTQPAVDVARRNLRDSMLHALGMAISDDLIRYVQVCTCDGSYCGHGEDDDTQDYTGRHL